MQDFDNLAAEAEPKRPGVGSFLVGTLVGALVGAALTMAVVAATAQNTAPFVQATREASPVSSQEVSETEAPPSSQPQAASAVPAAKAVGAKDALFERAEEGDQDALNQLESKNLEERSSQEAFALATGKTAIRLKHVLELEKKLNVVPRAGREPETLKQIREYAYTPELGLPTLKMLTRLDNEVGADILFTLWNRAGSSDFISELARELLYSRDVYAKASPAMKVVLDLRSVKECERALDVMDRVKQYADQRALLSLQPFYSRKGCGAFKEKDCWPCIRNSEILEEATVAARTRAPP